ncbi:hypothetical protein L599_004900000180 [Luteimonas sp. J16]|uniref:hypothetical protein n=1 Tax=unclassified Luteimonas TaxID=2629088 RepID=UPI0004AEBD5B|nr:MULTISPECIES: hypothetical protein [unclassified Luteimonas]TWG89067.1 hypothetical protein L599_004900000180 [Luteimonas sp. J16]
MADQFDADLRARYGRPGSTFCTTQASERAMRDLLEQSARQHAGKEIVRTGIVPRR